MMIEPVMLADSAVGVAHFFAGFVLIITIYSGFLGFTYWISKDE